MSKHEKSEPVEIPTEGFVQFDPAEGEQATLAGEFTPVGVFVIDEDGVHTVDPAGFAEGEDPVMTMLNAIFGDTEKQEDNPEPREPNVPKVGSNPRSEQVTHRDFLEVDQAEGIEAYFLKDPEEFCLAFQKGQQELVLVFTEEKWRDVKGLIDSVYGELS